MCMECHMTPCHPRCPNAPDPAAVYDCAFCNEPIRAGDDYVEFDGEHYHRDCYAEKAPSLAIEAECMKHFEAVEDDDTQIGICRFCGEPVLKSEEHYKWRKYPKKPGENPSKVEYLHAHHECLIDNAESLLQESASTGVAEEEAYYPEYDPCD